MKKQRGDRTKVYSLEKGRDHLAMEERFLESAQEMLNREIDAAGKCIPLHQHQIPVLLSFREYLMNLATQPGGIQDPPFCRIVLPPRTGKTVIAGEIISQTGLCSAFVVPTKTLVQQTMQMLRTLLPGVPIGLYYGVEKRPVRNGVNITTYNTLQRHFFTDCLPTAVRRSALVFVDEAHHSMTELRLETLHKAFDKKSIRLALTATPDYGDHRKLKFFFPQLIYEMELLDAMDQKLLAPTRMWVAEVDANASVIRLVAGDYEPEILGRLMSSSPFFQAVRIFRYSTANRDVPALIVCASRQQAHDLRIFLEQHKPPDRPIPALVLGETPEKERNRILRRFDQGHIDTLIQVGVLIEGWNAPRCKLLLDLAPSLSRVRATQKYFRVMTRYDGMDARIVVILPRNLPKQPILPIDLILKPGETYECGDLIKNGESGKTVKRALIDGPKKTPIKSIRIKTHLVACAELAKPKLNPHDFEQIRQVLTSCPEFKLRMPFGSRRFRRLFFNHPFFVGSGEMLLRYIVVSDGEKAFSDFIAGLFPEEFGNLIIDQNGGPVDVVEHRCIDDFRYLVQAAVKSNKNGGKPEESLLHTLNALCGGAKVTATPEEMLLRLEQINSLLTTLVFMDHRLQQAIIKRLGLFGESESTWYEIGRDFNVSRERARQIFLRALSILRKKHLRRTMFDRPILNSIEEYPDLAQIVFEPSETFL